MVPNSRYFGPHRGQEAALGSLSYQFSLWILYVILKADVGMRVADALGKVVEIIHFPSFRGPPDGNRGPSYRPNNSAYADPPPWECRARGAETGHQKKPRLGALRQRGQSRPHRKQQIFLQLYKVALQQLWRTQCYASHEVQRLLLTPGC